MVLKALHYPVNYNKKIGWQKMILMIIKFEIIKSLVQLLLINRNNVYYRKRRLLRCTKTI